MRDVTCCVACPEGDVEDGQADRWSHDWAQATDNAMEYDHTSYSQNKPQLVKSVPSSVNADHVSESRSAAVERRSQSREKRQQELSSRLVNVRIILVFHAIFTLCLKNLVGLRLSSLK